MFSLFVCCIMENGRSFFWCAVVLCVCSDVFFCDLGKLCECCEGGLKELYECCEVVLGVL